MAGITYGVAVYEVRRGGEVREVLGLEAAGAETVEQAVERAVAEVEDCAAYWGREHRFVVYAFCPRWMDPHDRAAPCPHGCELGRLPLCGGRALPPAGGAS